MLFTSDKFNYAIAEILDEGLKLEIEDENAFISELKGLIREAVLEGGHTESEDLEIFIKRTIKMYKYTELFDMLSDNDEEFATLYEQTR